MYEVTIRADRPARSGEDPRSPKMIVAPPGSMVIIGPLSVVAVRYIFDKPFEPIARIGFGDVSGQLLKKMRPSCVVSALMGAAYDGWELAACLQKIGYTGKYRAVSRPIPNAANIAAEISEIAPDIDCDLVMIGSG